MQQQSSAAYRANPSPKFGHQTFAKTIETTPFFAAWKTKLYQIE
jgi:hypothetical protein